MASLPTGYAIRPPTFDDVEAIADVLLTDDLVDAGLSVYDADFVRDQWSSPGFDLATDAWVVLDPDGTAIAHANVTPDGPDLVKSWGVVHLEHRGIGIGSALLDRVEARALQRLAGLESARLHHAINDVDMAARALLVARGFSFVRSFRHMQVDLDGPRDPGAPPTGIQIEGIDPERDLARAHAIFVEAFADEWGYRVIPFEEWRALEVDVPGSDVSLWLLASDGEHPVGALNATVFGDRGWIGELAVLRGWRRRGIGSAMLQRSFATFAERGLSRVLLNVDFENPTAMRVYERAGMRAVRGWDVYEKPIG